MRPPSICHDCGNPIPRNSALDVKRGALKFTVCPLCKPARDAEAKTLQREAGLRGHVAQPRQAKSLKPEPKKAQPSVCPGNAGGPHYWLLPAEGSGLGLTQGTCKHCGQQKVWTTAYQPSTVLGMQRQAA